MRPVSFKNRELTEKEKRSIDILEILRRFGPISRPEISQRLGVNIVTVSNYIEEFIKNKLVVEKALDISEGGRRPVLLDLNPRIAYAVGVGLNLTSMVGLLVDIKGNIVLKTQLKRPGTSVKEVLETVLEITREILRRSKDYTQNIRGIGIGMAGIINKQDGLIHWPERISNHNYTYASVNLPLKDLVEKEFGLPTSIENDATAACFGEQWLDLEPGIKDILYMVSGVGCGIMINGQIYTGSKGCAGEVSIHNYKQDHLFNCSLGSPCFLKRWEIDLGIVEEVKNRFAVNPEQASQLSKLVNNKAEDIDLKNIFLAAREGDKIAKETLEIAAKRLGIRIAYLVNIFNPEVVVIGGGLEEAGEDFLVKVEQTIREWAFREMTEDLKVVYTQLKENAVALGAASLVVREVFAHI
ncbi:MAG: ROK family transcriptional regulator [Candidatus Omnitrophota bacterium]|jgi:predicted NBD/HSP70 family sugar kinase